MEMGLDFLARLLGQFQSPALAFLVGGMVLSACRSQLVIPNAFYQFAVFVLLMRIGMKGGMALRDTDVLEMLAPAAAAALIGMGIVVLGSVTLGRLPGIRREDALATAGLFGAVSASTLAAAMVVLDDAGIGYEPWIPALYPFMDIPALVLAIVLCRFGQAREMAGPRVTLQAVVIDSLRGSALSALVLGLALGLLTRPDPVFESFYDPMFKGLLSILLLVMGMEAYSRLADLRRVAHWYAVYAVAAPLVHGVLAFAMGYGLHLMTGFSPGGVVLLAVLAASSSDISGPPTLRTAIPEANPSAYLGASTSIGTPVAIVLGIPLFVALARAVFGA